MAKILIATNDCKSYLSGFIPRGEYQFTEDKNNSFCFSNVREALAFTTNDIVSSFLEGTTTTLVDYDNPDRIIYQAS
jgi:hypothetical protein